jgi:hypothetical protein
MLCALCIVVAACGSASSTPAGSGRDRALARTAADKLESFIRASTRLERAQFVENPTAAPTPVDEIWAADTEGDWVSEIGVGGRVQAVLKNLKGTYQCQLAQLGLPLHSTHCVSVGALSRVDNSELLEKNDVGRWVMKLATDPAESLHVRTSGEPSHFGPTQCTEMQISNASYLAASLGLREGNRVPVGLTICMSTSGQLVRFVDRLDGQPLLDWSLISLEPAPHPADFGLVSQ